MNRIVIVAAAVVVATGLAVGLLVFRGDDSGPDMSADGDHLEVDGNPRRIQRSPTEHGPGPVNVGPGVAKPSTAPGTPVLRGPRIRVVDEDSRPMIGADVSVIDLERHGVRMAQDPNVWPLDRQASELGLSLRSDESGEIVGPRCGFARVIATLGDRWGTATYDSQDSSVVVRIVPDHDLVIRVLDFDGTPARDVPLVATRVGPRGSTDIARVTTDLDGLAILSHVLSRRDEDHRVKVRVATPLVPAVAEELALGDDRRELTLRLPATGVLEIRLESRERRFAEWHCYVVVTAERGEERQSSGRISVSGGVCRMPHVGLGTKLTVNAESRGPVSMGDRKEMAGPRYAGETVTAMMWLAAESPWGVVRLVGPDGPLSAHRMAHLELQVNGESTASIDTQQRPTIDGGRLFVPLPNEESPADRPHLLTIVAQGNPKLEGRLEFTTGFERGEHELGDLVLEPHRLTVSGRVVTEGGEPLSGASVSAVDPSNGETADSWKAVSDAEGEFAMFGVATAAELRVSAYRKGMFSSTVQCAPGAEGVTVIMTEASGLDGQIALGDRIRPREILLVLTPVDRPGPVRRGDCRLTGCSR